MKRIRIVSPLALLLGALLTTGSATGYVLLIHGQTWNCPPNYTVDQTGIPTITDSDGGVSNVIAAISSASDAWNGAGSARILSAHKGSTAGFTLGDGVPMIKFGDPLGACLGNCLAATYIVYISQRSPGADSWQVDDADIVTNLAYNWTSQEEDPNGSGCSGEYYIEGVMVHEIGHALGLHHSSAAGATMLPSVSSCDNSPATTSADDRNGIRALYGTAPCSTNVLLSPCSAYTEYLTSGSSQVQPCGGSFAMSGSGTIKGWVEGPDGTDFDLFLDKLVNGSWLQVWSATSTSSSDSITYSATPGTFRFRVTSYSGSGTYHFWYQRPTFLTFP
ncbi:MAG TPA: matrixin family metalloprotease [Thermoanaerobaculia bacterium]|nr:matrixin family metalloprotease [Thermoanaerobaculia bacterium]